MTAEYIESLNILSQEIYKLPKLSIEDICSESHTDYEKIFLCGFYEYYDELDKYDIKELNYSGMYWLHKNILMTAAQYNKIRLIKYLISRGIDINILDNSNHCAYIYALCSPNVKIKTLKLLEGNGVSIKNFNRYKNKYTYLLFVLLFNKTQRIKVLEYFKSRFIDIHKINIFEYYNSCFYAQNIKIFKYLEANGSNIHNKDTSNNNIYSFFCRYCCRPNNNILRLLKYLKSRGIGTYYSKNYNFCKRNGYYKTLKFLIKSNCDNRFKNITCYI